MDSRLICVRGRLTSPTTILIDQGEFDVQKETFYRVGAIMYFLLDIQTYPWLIKKAIIES